MKLIQRVNRGILKFDVRCQDDDHLILNGDCGFFLFYSYMMKELLHNNTCKTLTDAGLNNSC